MSIVAPVRAPKDTPCPAWCAGVNSHDTGEHLGAETELLLSLGTPYSTGFSTEPDHAAVSTRTEPGGGATVVVIRHVDDYLPDLTLSEAETLGWLLLRTAAIASGSA
jgi:hypothetical protein